MNQFNINGFLMEHGLDSKGLTEKLDGARGTAPTHDGMRKKIYSGFFDGPEPDRSTRPRSKDSFYMIGYNLAQSIQDIDKDMQRQVMGCVTTTLLLYFCDENIRDTVKDLLGLNVH